MVRFDLGPLLHGQMRVAKLKKGYKLKRGIFKAMKVQLELELNVELECTLKSRVIFKE